MTAPKKSPKKATKAKAAETVEPGQSEATETLNSVNVTAVEPPAQPEKIQLLLDSRGDFKRVVEISEIKAVHVSPSKISAYVFLKDENVMVYGGQEIFDVLIKIAKDNAIQK